MSIRTTRPDASSLASPSRAPGFAWAWVSVAVMIALLVGTFATGISEILGLITVVVALIAVWGATKRDVTAEERGLVPAVRCCSERILPRDGHAQPGSALLLVGRAHI